jgi:hydrogenase nickel incorporation protein HypB
VNVVALSVTEGEDKPLKYPVIFRNAGLVLLTKTDLLPHLDFRVDAVLDALARVMPQPEVLRVSARTGEGIPEWVAWLQGRRAALIPATLAASAPHRHP